MITVDKRAKQLKAVAESLFKGATTVRSREFPYTIWRGVILKQLCDEGYKIDDISRAMEMCHASVIHWRNKIDTVLYYKFAGDADILDIYQKFVNKMSVEADPNDNRFIFLTVGEVKAILGGHMESEKVEGVIEEMIKNIHK